MRNDLGSRRIVAGLAVLIASIWITTGVWLSLQARQVDAQERRELAAVAHILTEHVERTLQSVDRLMQLLAPRLIAARGDPGALQRLLRGSIQDLPHVRAGLVLDADGVSIGDSESVSPRPFHGGDREYFRVHRDNERVGLFIGPPVRSRINGQWAISLSRRLLGADGGFAGVLTLAVDPQYFVELFGAVAGLEMDSVSLLGRDGVLRARFPGNDAWLGQQPYGATGSIEANPFGNMTGWFRATSAIDGVERELAYRAAAWYPLVVTVGRSTAIGVAEHRVNRVLAIAAAALLTILVLVLHRSLVSRLQASQAQARLLEDARARAVASEAAKSRFLAGMSHELRTPLNAILGFAELLRDERIASTAARRDEYAGHIHDAGVHLLTSVNEILDQASIEAGRVRLELEEADPCDVVRSATRMVERAAERAGVRLTTRCLDGSGRVIADVQRLRQVVVNLVANAVKFTPAGGAVEVLCGRSPAGGAIIRVVDTGVGMTDEQIAVAFEPFGRVDNAQTRAREGTGLGLPIAKALAELQGATLAVTSRLGAGTTVAIEFPSSAVRA